MCVCELRIFTLTSCESKIKRYAKLAERCALSGNMNIFEMRDFYCVFSGTRFLTGSKKKLVIYIDSNSI